MSSVILFHVCTKSSESKSQGRGFSSSGVDTLGQNCCGGYWLTDVLEFFRELRADFAHPKMYSKVVLTLLVLCFILVTGDDEPSKLEEAKKVAKMAKNFHETVGGNNSESHLLCWS